MSGWDGHFLAFSQATFDACQATQGNTQHRDHVLFIIGETANGTFDFVYSSRSVKGFRPLLGKGNWMPPVPSSSDTHPFQYMLRACAVQGAIREPHKTYTST